MQTQPGNLRQTRSPEPYPVGRGPKLETEGPRGSALVLSRSRSKSVLVSDSRGFGVGVDGWVLFGRYGFVGD